MYHLTTLNIDCNLKKSVRLCKKKIVFLMQFHLLQYLTTIKLIIRKKDEEF